MAFHLHRDGKAVEFALDDLKAMARRGELRQDEYVYDDVKAEWIGAALVPELQGAWDLEENESTVAMELPPDFFEKFDEEEKAAKDAAQLDGPTTREPSPAPAPTGAAPVAGDPPADDEEATRAMDLAELESRLSAAPDEQEEATVAMDIASMQLPEPAPSKSKPQPAPAPQPPPQSQPAPQSRPEPQSRPAPQERPASRPQAAAGRVPAPRGGRQLNRPLGDQISPVVAALLSFFTCNIYTLVWLWKRGEETNKFLGSERLPRWFVPLIIGVAIVFAGGIGALTFGAGAPLGWLPAAVVTAVWAYKFGECVNEMASGSRLNVGDRKVVYALCAIFPPVLLFLGQQDLNEIWQANGATKG